MHVECIYDAESIGNVIIHIKTITTLTSRPMAAIYYAYDLPSILPLILPLDSTWTLVSHWNLELENDLHCMDVLIVCA